MKINDWVVHKESGTAGRVTAIDSATEMVEIVRQEGNEMKRDRFPKGELCVSTPPRQTTAGMDYDPFR